MAKKVVPLDKLLNRVAGFVSANGVEYPVIACNAIDYQTIQRAMQHDPDLTMAEVVTLARKLCPSLPEDIWQAADSTIVGVVLATSTSTVEEVEDALPNSSGPTTSQVSPAASPSS